MIRDLYAVGLVRQIWLRGDAGGACAIVEAASSDEVAQKVNALPFIREGYRKIRSEVGRVDVVFANAGVVTKAPLGSLTEEHVENQLDVNVKGVIWTVQKALPLMGPGGSIILNASIVASKGWADWSVYSASKAAVRNFARTWSSDLRGQGIRVNAISPGVIPTPAHENASASRDALNSFMAYAASITPLARTGTDAEVAKVVAFLASDDSSVIAASEIFVDGAIAQI